MPRWVKRTLWLGVFGVCAGAGAFVAAHTNPFPPGVEDPGARPTTSAPTTPAPSNQRWNLVMDSASRHDLHVGGSCRSRWFTSGHVTILPDGTAEGEALASLRGWGCDFPVAQVQTRKVSLFVTGRRSGGRIVLGFKRAGVAPTGSQDLGGFLATIRSLAPAIPFTDGHGGAVATASRPDGDLGRFVDKGEIQLDCATGC
ncbi:MAG: hypothetical protein E6G65_12215 [Actinobacteria bacterium]|nr:MAG: hypothetical protein E6G65_12215 [Actinomycetota bacterium]